MTFSRKIMLWEYCVEWKKSGRFKCAEDIGLLSDTRHGPSFFDFLARCDARTLFATFASAHLLVLSLKNTGDAKI